MHTKNFLSILFLLIAFSLACAPSAQDNGVQNSDSDFPEITDEVINAVINDAYLVKVPEETGAAEPIGWSFDEDEPKEIKVIDKKIDGTSATIVLDIITKSSKRSREQRQLAGQIRTEWKLQTGWALRQWEIVKTENISMKYKNLPKPPAPEANR